MSYDDIREELLRLELAGKVFTVVNQPSANVAAAAPARQKQQQPANRATNQQQHQGQRADNSSKGQGKHGGKGKKSGKTAAAYRTEANRRLEIEREEAAELAARRDLARSKVNLNLSLICYGEDYNAGNELRTILDMYASNTNIMVITNYMQSSQTCSMRPASQVHRASQFTEHLRRGNLVGIRSKANVQGVGYLYSFTHRENWDVGP